MWRKACWLIIDNKRRKKRYFLIKDFNTFIYDHSLYEGRKYFCRYSLQAFITEDILRCHINDCSKNNGKQRIIMLKKGEYVKFKNFERKIISPFMIYADFKCILVSEDNGKQNPNESYTIKYQKHVACSYDCICDNDCIDGDVKVRDYCHIAGKYRGLSHRHCNINMKLIHKIPAVFHKLNNYDSHLIMQNLCKIN